LIDNKLKLTGNIGLEGILYILAKGKKGPPLIQDIKETSKIHFDIYLAMEFKQHK